MHVANGYFLFVSFFFLAFMMLFGVFVVNWTNFISLLQFGFMLFFTFSFCLTFTKRLFSLFVPPFLLPRLDDLAKDPRVAVLYTTVDDVVSECLARIEQTHPVDVYVLDDSTDPDKRQLIDKVSAKRGYMVLRRQARAGYKAGAINAWLQRYGPGYEYFVLLDSDSMIPRDWIEECLRYAEHPANRNTAIFQGLINIWNLEWRFTRTLAPIHRLSQDEWERKMANYLDAVLFYGHNALIRTKPVLEAGGFPTEYVSEDFALAVRLADLGHHSRFVPLQTYEALPENVRGFVKRQNKWTRGSMEFFGFARRAKISWARKVILLEVPLGHISYLAVITAMFLAIYDRNSSWNAAVAFASGFLASPLAFIWSIPLFRYTLTLGLISALLAGLKLLQVRLHPTVYWRFQVLSRAIGAIMLPHEVRSIFYYLFNRTKRFPVTPKNEPPLALRDAAAVSWMTILLTVAFTVGVGIVNPVGLFYNLAWLLPFATAPLIIYYFAKPSGNMNLESNIDSLLATSLQFQPNRFRRIRKPLLQAPA